MHQRGTVKFAKDVCQDERGSTFSPPASVPLLNLGLIRNANGDHAKNRLQDMNEDNFFSSSVSKVNTMLFYDIIPFEHSRTCKRFFVESGCLRNLCLFLQDFFQVFFRSFNCRRVRIWMEEHLKITNQKFWITCVLFTFSYFVQF